MKYFLILILLLPILTLAQNHILITEIVVTPTAGEFVEIYNNTNNTIDLTDYYLTDATYSGGGAYYYNIVTGTNAGGGGFGDFHARFPAGASIAAGEFQTIAVDGAGFVTTYGAQPNYELNGTDSNIPDMLEAFSGSISGQGGITNSGEVMILYYWDGLSDLVQDVEYVVWGDKNEAVDKTGVSIDGPDPDSNTSSYLDDTSISQQISVSSADPHSIGKSIQRLNLIENNEIQSGGNGVTGNDETSEDLSASFQVDDPNPGSGPSANNSPVISNISQFPALPSSTDTVFIATDVTDDGLITSVKLFTSFNSASFDSTDMILQSGDTYESFVLPQAEGTEVAYYIKATDNDGLISTSSTFNYTITSGSNITPIADIQANPGYIGQQVIIEGIVTLGAGITATGWTDAYVQDSSGRGINIYQSGTVDPDLVRYNRVQITGTVDEYNGVTEITNYSAQVTATNQPLPDSLNLSTNDATNLTYEGTFIYVQGAIMDKYSAGGGTNLSVDDGSGAVDVRAWDTANLNLDLYNIGDTVSIKGVMDVYQGNAQILLAYQEDIDFVSEQIEPPIISNIVQNPLSPQPTDTTFITCEVSDNGTVMSVKLYTSINSAVFDSSDMILISGTNYQSYILPQPNNTQVQYYIQAKDDEGLVSKSTTFSYSVSGGGTFTPIANIQNNPGFIGQQVSIQGVVTLGAGITTTGWTDAYVQDSSGRGINIYQNGVIDADLVRKNLVQITGTVDEYNGTTEIINYSVNVIATNQSLPTPLQLSTISANDLGYEGTYISVQGVIVDKYAAGGGTTIRVDDGSGSIDFRAWDTAGLTLDSYDIGDTVSVKGVMDIYQGGAQISLAYQDEIEFTSLEIMGDGSGIVAVAPDTIAAGGSSDFTFNVTGNSKDTVTTITLEIPGDWNWAGSVNLSGGAFTNANTNINGKMISISNAELKQNNQGQIEVFGLTAPSEGKISLFNFKTATMNGILTNVTPLPMVFVIGSAGTGEVSVTPDSVGKNTTNTLAFMFKGNSISTVSKVEMTVPADWGWSGLSNDVNVSGAPFGAANVAVNGNLVEITDIDLTDNSEGTVELSNLVSSTVDTVSQFSIKTGDVIQVQSIENQPLVMVGSGTQQQFIPISSIQLDSSWIGKNVTVRAVVTIGSGILRTDYTDTYVQDSTGYGINVFSFDPPDPDIVRGSLLLVKGLVEEYQGTTEITNYALTVLRKNVPIPAIREITTGSTVTSLDLEGSFVRISGTIVDKYSAGGGTNIEVDDGSGGVILRIWDTAELDLSSYQVGDGINASGVVGEYNNEGQLLVGYQEDIQHIVLPKSPAFLELPNKPFVPDRGEILVIKYSAGSEDTHTTMRIYDLAGRLVTTLLDDKGRSFAQQIEWNGRNQINDLVPLGAYILHYEVVNESDGKTWQKAAPIVVGTVLK